MPHKTKELKRQYIEEYYKKNAHLIKIQKRKYYLKNKKRITKTNELYKLNNPEKYKLNTKKTVLKKRYGLSYEKYQEMIKNQNNQCAICHKHQSELKQILCIDHDHNTNKVRELLCNKCNVALAAFENFDNKPFLEYLKKHKEKLN
jgi:nitrate/TMAO reductase-like tetraheme cytochrome c subunit